eukprot:CAMPEP_0204060490 /NCGR_PEP_ID=MMETSP0360-20130528/140074_1 /ASSEMBLY_ACC=CAM_ASM_000342 /TAXON_ID=268821 /ORGANISM="Scrippsiella Hangoei, Strain SHTV-5" /LENGTH=105 /DNA_ID=CAMNT_0051008159 /DNA_START=249 /DNA_END=567 /DNA_ORIENTATION=-
MVLSRNQVVEQDQIDLTFAPARDPILCRANSDEPGPKDLAVTLLRVLDDQLLGQKSGGGAGTTLHPRSPTDHNMGRSAWQGVIVKLWTLGGPVEPGRTPIFKAAL